MGSPVTPATAANPQDNPERAPHPFKGVDIDIIHWAGRIGSVMDFMNVSVQPLVFVKGPMKSIEKEVIHHGDRQNLEENDPPPLLFPGEPVFEEKHGCARDRKKQSDVERDKGQTLIELVQAHLAFLDRLCG